MPTVIRQGQQKIDIDFNLIPYYGEPSPLEAPYIYRSQAKNGTCSFYAYIFRDSQSFRSTDITESAL